MSLPKIAVPTFELTQPSTGEKLEYRPFLVKEEKILLTARESGERADVFRAIKQIINNCVLTDGFNVNKIPLFDMEYIFIQLRSVSIENTIKFQVQDSDDNITYDLMLDLNEVKVQFPEKQHDGIVKISETVGAKLKFPNAEISDHIKDLSNMTDVAHEMIMQCIDYIFDEENTYPWDKESKKDRVEFLDSLSIEVYNQMQEFFDESPKIEHIVTYTNSEGKEKKVVFRNLDDFFTLG